MPPPAPPPPILLPYLPFVEAPIGPAPFPKPLLLMPAPPRYIALFPLSTSRSILRSIIPRCNPPTSSNRFFKNHKTPSRQLRSVSSAPSRFPSTSDPFAPATSFPPAAQRPNLPLESKPPFFFEATRTDSWRIDSAVDSWVIEAWTSRRSVLEEASKASRSVFVRGW